MNPNYEAFMCVNESLAVVWQWKEGRFIFQGRSIWNHYKEEQNRLIAVIIRPMCSF